MRSWLKRLLFLQSLSDAEHMTVGMPHVHFPHVPRHVRGRPGYLDALLNALFMDGIHVLDPPAHPAPLVLRLVLETCEGARVRPFPASPLAAATHKDLARTGPNGAESRRVAPAPQLFPAQFGEPRKTGVHVRDIENRGYVVNDHCAAPNDREVWRRESRASSGVGQRRNTRLKLAAPRLNKSACRAAIRCCRIRL